MYEQRVFTASLASALLTCVVFSNTYIYFFVC